MAEVSVETAHQEGGNELVDPDIVRAKGFEVADDSGRVRARLGMNNENEPLMQLFDVAGQPRAQIGIGSEGGNEAPAVLLHDADGTTRAGLVVNLDGSASFMIARESGNPAVRISTMGEGMAGVELLRDDGSLSLRLIVRPLQTPAILMLDERGAQLAELAVGAQGNVALSLADKSEMVRAQFFLGEDGATAVSFNDSTGTTRVMVGLSEHDDPVMGAN